MGGVGIRIAVLVLLVTVAAAGLASAQRLAVISPNTDSFVVTVRDALSDQLSSRTRIVDASLAATAFSSVRADAPFNLTSEQSKQVGAVIGCDFFVLVQAAVLRRASLDRPDYFEAYAAVFAVSSRTGRLVRWELIRAESGTEADASKRLLRQIPPFAISLRSSLAGTASAEAAEPLAPMLEEPPDENSSAARHFRSPVPYRRIKPEYTSTAYLYGVTATVQILVDLDEKGGVTRTEITRWAGFGLDESVTDAVRKMNWRPAERGGKPLPMRFMLRYNFKKSEK